MEKLFVFMMLLPFMLLLIFQPALDRMEEGREKVVQVTIQRGVEKAAIDGYFTQDNIEDMNKLLNAVGYSEDEIEYSLTVTEVSRGEYVSGSIKAPNKYQFLMFENLFNGDDSEDFHFHSASRMSEALN